MLKLSIISECSYSIIKLTQDALKELIEINSCKYCVEVATHLKVHVIGQTFYYDDVDEQVINIEVGQVFQFLPAGRDHHWACCFRLLVHR